MKPVSSIILTMALIATTLVGQKQPAGDPDLARKIARFAPTTLTADTSKLTPKDRQALNKIIAAAKLLDPVALLVVDHVAESSGSRPSLNIAAASSNAPATECWSSSAARSTLPVARS